MKKKNKEKGRGVEVTRNEVFRLLDNTDTRQEGIHKLAGFCFQKFNLLTLDNDEVYIYNEGMYEPSGKKVLSAYVQKKLNLNKLVTVHVINEFQGYIKRYTYKKNGKIKEPKDKICLANGILNLNTLKIEKHNPEIIFFNKLPVHYNPKADCPAIKKFLSEIVNEENIPLIQEIIGYCLYKSYSIQKVFMFVGTGANGKTTLINLIKALLGHQNCCSVTLHRLETNRFSLSSLFGKLANMVGDLSATALKDTSFFKMLTGEDSITTEKKFQDEFSFTNYAKLISCCNQLPMTPDDSDAFFRRLIIVDFPNQFTDNADKKLIQKLTTPDELSGLLNFALEGLKRLLDRYDFTNTKSIDELREEYTRKSDSVGAYIMDCILEAPEDHVEKSVLYTNYADYCRERKYPIDHEYTFHRRLQAKIRVVNYKPLKEIEGKMLRVTCWKGIKIDEKTKIRKNVDNIDNKDRNNVKYVNNVNKKSLLNYKNKKPKTRAG